MWWASYIEFFLGKVTVKSMNLTKRRVSTKCLTPSQDLEVRMELLSELLEEGPADLIFNCDQTGMGYSWFQAHSGPWIKRVGIGYQLPVIMTSSRSVH